MNRAADHASNLPPGWPDLSGYEWVPQTIGQSGAMVFRLTAPQGPALFVKTESVSPHSELEGEAHRLEWLASVDQPAPRVLGTAQHLGRQWLLMTGVKGLDLASSPDLSPSRIIEICATSLRALHAIDVASCPFDHRLDTTLATARERLDASLVDETDFDDAHLGMPARTLYARLLAERPEAEDLVVTHGDACLPNFMASGREFSGFIDCGRLGVADRYQDLALATRSIAFNLGQVWAEPFLTAYGVSQPDRARIGYYRLLDEFF